MLKTLKMDLYRMFRSKSIYITLLITYILVVVSIFSFKMVMENEDLKSFYEQSMEASDKINMGINAGMIYVDTPEVTLVDLFSANIAGASIAVIAVIFGIIFVCSEHNSGYIKNVISRKGYRIYFSLSKAICMGIYLLISLLGTAVLIAGTSSILLENYVFGDISAFASYFMTQYLLHFAILLLILLICNLTRNMAISMAIGICICSGMVALLTSLLDKLKLDIVFSDYLLTTNMRVLPTTFDATIYTRAWSISVICGILFVVASIVILKRQDVR